MNCINIIITLEGIQKTKTNTSQPAKLSTLACKMNHNAWQRQQRDNNNNDYHYYCFGILAVFQKNIKPSTYPKKEGEFGISVVNMSVFSMGNVNKCHYCLLYTSPSPRDA